MQIKKKAVYSNLNKPSFPRASRPLTKTPGTIIFASYPKKKVDKKYIDSFWEKYFNGEIKKVTLKRKDQSYISSYNKKVKVFYLSPSVTITIKKTNRNLGNYYLKLRKKLITEFKKHNFNNSEIVLADIIDYKIKDGYYYIIERIIPSITYNELLGFRNGFYEKNFIKQNRYLDSFLRSINKIDLNIRNKMYKDIGIAYSEIFHFVEKMKQEEIDFDLSSRNTIIIDYNPKTGKVKFGFIDLMAKIDSKSF